ncbi:organic hydroperoxide resistance protein [Isobaculum melis]|uniref:Peroxiredoxin, Ohr subfamily n=1 Tax=Isobaculum melis TaxID=142588 RepID=A0A1H9RJ14_9LACT|nr:organic hydroperoxide resistance protein [Isobaculum melis]SER72726.1 peroxiredoxin, Ohr subfamily [Isobaculum melis]
MTDSNVLYQTKAVNTNGRDGESHLADHSFSVRVSTPKQLGGPGQGSNPEQLFAIGYSACYNSALAHKMKEHQVTGEATVAATVQLLSDSTDKGFKLAVLIEVAITELERAQVEQLAKEAHEFCPYSKATRGNIEVEIKVVDKID